MIDTIASFADMIYQMFRYFAAVGVSFVGSIFNVALSTVNILKSYMFNSNPVFSLFSRWMPSHLFSYIRTCTVTYVVLLGIKKIYSLGGG